MLLIPTAVYFIGSSLPTTSTISRRAHFNHRPETLWEIIADFQSQTVWRDGLVKVERLPNKNGRQIWRETVNQEPPLTLETVESIPPRRLVRRLSDQRVSFEHSWTLEIGEYGEVTSLTITENNEIHNPIFRFMSRISIKRTGDIDKYIKSLGKKLGVGVTITPA